MSFIGDLAKRGVIFGNPDEVLIDGTLFRKQATPATMIGDATITVAALLGGIIEATPIAASAYTLPLGTAMDDALTSFMINNASFDFTIINLSTTAADVITLTVNTGFTIVGQPIIEAQEGTALYLSSGTFRVRKTAADVFVAYRL